MKRRGIIGVHDTHFLIRHDSQERGARRCLWSFRDVPSEAPSPADILGFENIEEVHAFEGRENKGSRATGISSESSRSLSSSLSSDISKTAGFMRTNARGHNSHSQPEPIFIVRIPPLNVKAGLHSYSWPKG
jgi:hypothetical protein